MAELRTLEHSTLKVPYELLNKKFRGAQKVIDREVSKVQGSITDLEEYLKNPASVMDITTMLDTMVDRLTVLKRKAGESFQEELDAAQRCKRRIDHLKEYDDINEAGNLLWMKKRMERMLVEYFFHLGFYTTATELAKQTGIEDLTNVDLFLIVKEVEDSLLEGDTSRCLAWCQENKSKLRKAKSTLEFNVRQQEFIEMVRKGQRLEAVKHARRHLVTLAEDVQVQELQHVMGLLAFSPDTQISPYKELFNLSRWKLLAEQFKEENFKLYQLNITPTFIATIQMGLSSLKTHQCYADHSKNIMCPVCTKHFNALAQGLAFSHCTQSRLICRISGKPLNEHNIPMMLPNGYVYGLEALTQMANANDGKVTCPRTKDVFQLSEAEKVYVM